MPLSFPRNLKQLLVNHLLPVDHIFKIIRPKRAGVDLRRDLIQIVADAFEFNQQGLHIFRNMKGRFQLQQNERVGDAAPGAFGVAFDAFFFGFGQPNRQRGVTPPLLTQTYHSPFPSSVGSGCRP